jgi:ribonuclease P protein component
MFVDETYPNPRVGYALGRAFGSAVSRNRLRRQLRMLMADRVASVRPGVYVFGASSRAKNLSFAQLGSDLDRLLAKCAERSRS